MRISELSRTSGLPVPTIKFYLREGLLPPGDATAPRQADYSEVHTRRLRLIRTLTEIGGIALRDVRTVIEALEDESLSTHELVGVAHKVLGPGPGPGDQDPDVVEARAEVDRFVAELGWQVSEEAPARRALARALGSLRRLGREVDVQAFEPYARVAEEVAAWEVATLSVRRSRAEAVQEVVVGTVVFEAALVALRRLAQAHHSAKRCAGGRPVTPEGAHAPRS
ncbi:MAG: MerR family transcriptional regulator [Actinomycetota bacterium]|nr:MerR family transcriptional regulator [Actinomycetota bacterium]